MYLKRLFYICLICASVLMLGLNNSRITFPDTRPKNQSTQSQASDLDNAPEVTRYYVARSGNGTDGKSWVNAFQNVQAALVTAAASGGGEIWVAKGVYYPDEPPYPDDEQTSTFQLYNNLSLYGGFDTDDTQLSDRDWEKNLTVLSGDVDGDDFTNEDGVVESTDNINGKNAYHVVSAKNVGQSAVIDGFVITAGSADALQKFRGGGLLCEALSSGQTCDPIIRNTQFSGNYAEYGGAVYLLGEYGGTCNPAVENVKFSSNSARIGGSICIHGNKCGSNYSPLLNNVVFRNNSALEGGAMHIRSGNTGCIVSPVITNAIFSGNYASDYEGGALSNKTAEGGKSNPTFTNVTFSGNRAGSFGGAIYNYNSHSESEAKIQIRNSIIWNNMDISGTNTITSSIFQGWREAKVYIVNSIVQGTGKSGSGSWIDDENIVDGGGNKDTNPKFKTPVSPAAAPTTAGNLRLTKDSPAIDSGNNTYVDGIPTDLDGKARKVDGDGNGTNTVDMGAYEFVPTIKEPEYKINLPIVKR